MTKVAVLGAAGGIGQPLSLLMKLNSKVSSLALYDVANVHGVAADLSHVNTPAVVKGYIGQSSLPEALSGAKVILIPAGVPRKPGMTRDDLFSINSGIAMSLASLISKHAKDAFILVITNPVNSIVPAVAEVLKKEGLYDKSKLIGVTELDLSRASTFVSEEVGKEAGELKVNVVGGHSGKTIVPLISQLGIKFTQEQIDRLTNRIQFGGDEVLKAKDGLGSATLSMAYSGAKLASSVIDCIVQDKTVTETGFVETDVYKEEGLNFFSTRIDISRNGIIKVHPIGPTTEHEKMLLGEALPQLRTDILKGQVFAKTGEIQ